MPVADGSAARAAGRAAGRKPVSRALFRAAGTPSDGDDVSVGTMILGLGDRSFGWSILLFALVNMVPMPVGSTLFTAIPLLLLTGQMVLGLRHIALPGFVSRIRVGRRRFKGVIVRMRPVFRRVERVVRPRMLWLFSRQNERLVGVLLFAVAFALFLPMPGSGFIPATALLISAIGLVERDGVVLTAGLALGVVSIVITIVVAAALIAGIEALGAA